MEFVYEEMVLTGPGENMVVAANSGKTSLNAPKPGEGPAKSAMPGRRSVLRSDLVRRPLRNHAPDIAAMDLLVVPTIGFDLLCAFIIVRLDRRDLAWINVTTNPTAEWVARQLTEAFPWDGAPGYMIRDRDRIYGTAVTRRLRAMGIRDKPIAPASPWQNGVAERLIGSIRRDVWTISLS
jgi:transposase InsO family protein